MHAQPTALLGATAPSQHPGVVALRSCEPLTAERPALALRAGRSGLRFLHMKAPSWGKTPRDSIERECELRGKDKVVSGCISLLNGKSADAELIYALGGPPARWVFTGEAPGPDYWLRVWGARGLLWAWDDAALTCIMTALEDESWRVREMALRVVAKHRLADAATTVASLRDDPNSRVASAASRTHARLHKSPEDDVS